MNAKVKAIIERHEKDLGRIPGEKDNFDNMIYDAFKENVLEEFLNTYTEQSVKYIIKKELRWRIRDMLDKLNLNERIVYPGLDGLSQWLARHYYVKAEPAKQEATQ